MDFPPLILKKGEDRRLRAGHLWVFSNEVNTDKTPLDRFEPGQPVTIMASNGKVLGTGYINPHSLICARLVSRDPKHIFGPALITHRIKVALALRERIFDKPFYRLVYGESDGLPGLVVDCYGQILVVQINTAGMENAKDHVIGALAEVLRPEGMLLCNDTPSRALEGLASYVETASGVVPERVVLPENGCQFEVPLLRGQKTGWYYDHRLNRERMLHYVKGQRVLDVFSYVGAWGIQAAVAGADHVSFIEVSEPAIEYLKQNAVINQVAERVKVVPGEAFEGLKALNAGGETFDVIILDPPAFIKRRKDLKQGLVAYQRLNQLAMPLLTQDGILITASCSSHLHPEAFLDTIRRTALHVGRRLQITEQGHQAPDHPVHPAIPETNYLKTYFCRVLYGDR